MPQKTKKYSKAPLVILSHARPDYLEQVLRAVSQNNNKQRKIFLYQDAARFLNENHLINQSINLARRIIPEIIIKTTPQNLGTGLNTLRARDEVLTEFDRMILLEDDVVPTSYGLELMDYLLWLFEDDERVGLVGGYAGFATKRHNHLLLQNQYWLDFVPMDHLLFHGLWRDKYLKTRKTMEPYYDLIKDQGYQQRPHEKIREWMWSNGVSKNILTTSQDCQFVVSMLLNDQIKISSFTNNARYIGRRGLHATEQDWIRYDWSSYPVFPTHLYFQNDPEKNLKKELDFSLSGDKFTAIKEQISRRYFEGSDPIEKYLLKI
jgi:hypothetical protein